MKTRCIGQKCDIINNAVVVLTHIYNIFIV